MAERVSLNESMPNELLAEIFILSCYSDSELCPIELTYSQVDSLPGPQWILTRVCSLWRNLAIHTPVIWTSISLDIDYLEPKYRYHESHVVGMLRTLFARSDPFCLPLTVSYRKYATKGGAFNVLWGHRLFEVLMERCERWRSLILGVSILDCFPKSLKSIRDRLISLEELEVLVDEACTRKFVFGDAVEVVDNVMRYLGKLSSLQWLTVSHVSVFLTSEDWRHNWKNVTKFICTEKCTFTTAWRILEWAKKLQSLEIGVSKHRRHQVPDVIDPMLLQTILRHEKLVHLELPHSEWFSFLDHLSLPLLSTLHFKGSLTRWSELSSLVDFLRRSSPALESLTAVDKQYCFNSNSRPAPLDTPTTLIIGESVTLQTLKSLHWDLESLHSTIFFDYIKLPSLSDLRLSKCPSIHHLKKVISMLSRSACQLQVLHVEFSGLADITLEMFLKQNQGLKELSLRGPVTDYLLEKLALVDASSPDDHVIVPKLGRFQLYSDGICTTEMFISMVCSRRGSGLHDARFNVCGYLSEGTWEYIRTLANDSPVTVRIVQRNIALNQTKSLVLNEGQKVTLALKCWEHRPELSTLMADNIAKAVAYTLVRSPNFRIPEQFGGGDDDSDENLPLVEPLFTMLEASIEQSASIPRLLTSIKEIASCKREDSLGFFARSRKIIGMWGDGDDDNGNNITFS
ncbi:hypothetical protein VKT23_014527 [Stygiomarasmius scandens]|uniref:F-box domain-containing protein n=1 Tax=Marasmiellus scandens TaxID=2682957 RepID=A0ABR1J058_9AGAR